MHFSKTFAELLLDLPPELRDNAIQYRQLKKLINQVVLELSGLGLNPSLLHELITTDGDEGEGSGGSIPVKKQGEDTGERPAISGHTTLNSSGEGSRLAPNSTSEGSTGGVVIISTPDEGGKWARDAHAPTIPNPVMDSKSSIGKDGQPTKEIPVQLSVEETRTDSDKMSMSSEESGGGARTSLKNAERSGDAKASNDTLKILIENLHSAPSESLLPHDEPTSRPKVVYEFNDCAGKIEPKLRLRLPVHGGDITPSVGAEKSGLANNEGTEVANEPVVSPASLSLLWALQQGGKTDELPNSTESTNPKYREIVIPLASDTAFFNTLSTALDALSKHLTAVHDEFVQTLQQLAVTIGETARPVSYTSSGVAGRHSHGFMTTGKNDLSSWREIFQLYVESDVFESMNEVRRGELPVEESDKRLRLFVERITQRGLGDSRKLKMKKSRDALETFLQLNIFILNVKKFQFANTEATRKILKKHEKRTALPLVFMPGATSGNISGTKPDLSEYALLLNRQVSSAESTTTINWLPTAFVHAIGEVLLPVIPHLDDYACLICTTIAFKPIRLNCGHLFCVRCLVKMQKRGKDSCPMCRAPNVLIANRSNVDWAMLNFMSDWFADEVAEKLKVDAKEIHQEELIEMGLDPSAKCIIC